MVSGFVFLGCGLWFFWLGFLCFWSLRLGITYFWICGSTNLSQSQANLHNQACKIKKPRLFTFLTKYIPCTWPLADLPIIKSFIDISDLKKECGLLLIRLEFCDVMSWIWKHLTHSGSPLLGQRRERKKCCVCLPWLWSLHSVWWSLLPGIEMVLWPQACLAV